MFYDLAFLLLHLQYWLNGVEGVLQGSSLCFRCLQPSDTVIYVRILCGFHPSL